MYISEAFPYYIGRHNSVRDYHTHNPWYVVVNNDFVFGQFLWAGVDYLGESVEWPSKNGLNVHLIYACLKNQEQLFSEQYGMKRLW